MAYKIEVDQDEEGWKVVKENAIETEEGFEDELLALFYNPHLAEMFVVMMEDVESKL